LDEYLTSSGRLINSYRCFREFLPSSLG
jgi:hypothetical protein